MVTKVEKSAPVEPAPVEGKKKLTKNPMFVKVLEIVLEEFKEKSTNGELPKKFSVELISSSLREQSKKMKEEKRLNKGSGNITKYNIFVQREMPVVKEEYPNLSGSERMTMIGERWRKVRDDPEFVKTLVNDTTTAKKPEKKTTKKDDKKDDKKKDEKKKDEKKPGKK
tara:strand:- start:138 stop:641 length:504 start_codon:yes stop_codon:yes gene_type:complete